MPRRSSVRWTTSPSSRSISKVFPATEWLPLLPGKQHGQPRRECLSLFPIPYSLFPVPYSLFPILRPRNQNRNAVHNRIDASTLPANQAIRVQPQFRIADRACQLLAQRRKGGNKVG